MTSTLRVPDEGYIKFECRVTPGPPPSWSGVESLAALVGTRARLRARGWLGQYEEGPLAGVGFGNVSVRDEQAPRFWISGSATGGIEDFDAEHVALVTGYDLEQNRVECVGRLSASSETMTHAALYEARSELTAVLHIHAPALWRAGLEEPGLLRTGHEVPYGTPEMARETARVAARSPRGTPLVLLMAGHEEGLLAAASSLAEAEAALIHLAASLGASA
jgi:hypothetical protein